MADIPIDWNLAQQPQSLDFTPSVVEGAQAGQALRGISALRGIDINDPNSLNAGMANLVRAGAADQASALMGLQIQRSAYSMLPQINSFLNGSSGASQAPSPPADPNAATGQPQTPNPQAEASLNTQVAGDLRTYGNTPAAQQPALASQLESKYLALGLPKAAIDNALQQASTPQGAEDYAAHHDAHAALATGATTPNNPALQPPGGSYPWASNLLGNPGVMAAMNVLKSRGLDMTGLIGTAQAIQAPTIAKQAEIAGAPALKAIDVAGNVQQAAQTAPIDVAKNVATAVGTTAGTAPYDMVTLKGPNGEDVHMTRSQMAALAQTPGGLPNGPGIGTATDLAGQAQNLNAASDAAKERLAQAPLDVSRGQALLGLANAVGTGKYTAALSQAAQYLPVTHTAAQYASNSSLLSQDLSSTFHQALNGMAVPRVAIEAKSILGGIPNSSSPQDQVKVYAAGLLAATQYNQAHDQFIQNWAADPSKPRSLSQADAAWQAGPGKASLFSMPAFQGVTVGGKPAVDTFVHGGKAWLIPLPGLLGTHIKAIPAS